MIAFPDTSFLCAFYRRQDNSPQAAAYFKALPETLHPNGTDLGPCVKCGNAAASSDNSRGHCVACDRAWVESWREAERARHAGPKRKAGW